MIDSGFAASTPHHNAHTARRIKERIDVESGDEDEGSEMPLKSKTVLYKSKYRFLKNITNVRVFN